MILNKHIIVAVTAMASALVFTACTNDDAPVNTASQSQTLIKFKEMTNDTHVVELYSQQGHLEQGYNEVTVRIKDKISGQYSNNAEVSWLPVMHMTSMMHSCPKSGLEKKNETYYEGYIVFQMAQMGAEYWDLTVKYTINGKDYIVTDAIDVPASDVRRVSSLTGTDGQKYVVAYAEPNHPKIGKNDIKVGVWKMQDMMNYPVADGYSVKIDPRMPSMGNHGSPDNVPAIQENTGGLYKGLMNLTMTGYWKLNLQLLSPEGTVLKGEEISESKTESSIYFELEF